MLSNKLIASITALPDEHILFANSKAKISVIAVKQLANVHKVFVERLAGKSLGLSMRDNLQLSLWIILLDGIARRLTILPSEMTDEQKNHFSRLAEIDVVLDDHGELGFNLDSHFNVQGDKSLPEIYTLPMNTEWILATSGTTGVPKLVKHSLSSLSQTVKKTSSGLRFIWGALYDIQRYAGLQVFLQAVQGGSTLIFSDEIELLKDKIALFSKYQVNALSATPTMWRKILMQTNAGSLSLSLITLGGEIVDEGILNALSRLYTGTKIRHIYASTEAGVGFSISDKKAGFPASYLTNPPNGISLRVDERGVLYIKSASNALGYLNAIQLEKDTDNYVKTGDKVQLHDERYFFCGRENGVINVGGNKVFPEEIEAVLLTYEGVKMAVVSAQKNAITGALIQVKIVLDVNIEDKQQFIARLRKYCSSQLEPYKVPAIYHVVDTIDMNATGKLHRAG